MTSTVNRAAKPGFYAQFMQLPHRQAFHMAWPMILSNISAPLMGIADTAMLGHLGSALYLGAVAIGANIIAFLFWIFAFLRMGTTSFVGRAWGADDMPQLQLKLGQSLLLAVVAGLLLIALQGLIVPLAVYLMAPDPEIAALAARYCHIRLSAAPAVFVTFVVIGLLIGLQNTRIPLLITVSSNALNIGLDYLFIVHFDWASDGAAVATLIAEVGACGCAVYLGWRTLRQTFGQQVSLPSWRELSDFPAWAQLISLNRDLFIRTALLLFIFNFFTAQSGQLGPIVLAANAILMQLVLFQAFGLDGYAHAAEAMGARALGARQLADFMRACAASAGAGLLMAVAVTVIFLLTREPLIHLFTDLPDVRRSASAHFHWLALFPIVSVWTYMFDGIFIGAGRTRILLRSMLICVFLVFLPLWWLSRGLGNHGLWMTFVMFNAARGASLAVAFYTLSVRRSWF